MRIINILRCLDSITVILEEKVYDSNDCEYMHTFEQVAKFPCDRPECAKMVTDIMSRALNAPLVWL